MNLGGDGDAKTPGSDENAKGVPEFWLHIFRYFRPSLDDYPRSFDQLFCSSRYENVQFFLSPVRK